MTSDTPETAPQNEDPAEPAPDQGYAPDELQAEAGAKKPPADVNLDLVLEVPVTVSLQVGSTRMPIKDLVRLVEGSVIALDREASEPMDVLVNGRLIAHGEIVLVDNRFGVRLTDVVSAIERIAQIEKLPS